jgi:hypothetical protein
MYRLECSKGEEQNCSVLGEVITYPPAEQHGIRRKGCKLHKTHEAKCLCHVYQTLLELQRALGHLMRDKRVLVIVDDVWLEEQLDLVQTFIGFKSR